MTYFYGLYYPKLKHHSIAMLIMQAHNDDIIKITALRLAIFIFTIKIFILHALLKEAFF